MQYFFTSIFCVFCRRISDFVREIFKLVGLIKQKGYSLVPISLYFSGNFVKVELGIGKGKKLYDKREDIAKKDAELRIRKQYGKIL